jgi:hypothetical protein
MAKFILKISLFLLVGLLILNFVVASLFISSPWSRFPNSLWKYRIEQRIKTEIPPHINTIILGGSVGGQLFGYGYAQRSDIRNSFTTNAATSMVGQYILAYHAILHNKNIKYLILAVVPHALSYPFDHPQTYGDLLKPFYTFENRKHFSSLVYSKMNKKPLSYFIIFPMIKIAKCFSDINFGISKYRPSVSKKIMADITVEYLKKLQELTNQYNVELILICPPVAKSKYRTFKDFKLLKQQVKENQMTDLFKNYFRNIIYYSDDVFIADGIHYTTDFMKKQRDKIIAKILPVRYIIKNNYLRILADPKRVYTMPLILEKIDPQGVMAGQPFKQQLQIRCNGKNFTRDTVLVWEQGVLPTEFVNDGLVTAKIPDFYYEEAGDCWIYLYDRKTGIESNKLTFKVKKPLIWESEILSQSFTPPITVTVSKSKTIIITHSHFYYRIQIEAEKKEHGQYWGRWQINWHDEKNKFISTSLIPFNLDEKRKIYISPMINNIPPAAKTGILYLTSHNENPILIHSFRLMGIDVDFTREGGK